MQNKKILSTLVTRSLRHPWLRAGGGKTKFLSEFVCVASAYNTGLTVQERNNINDGIVSLLHPNFASRPGGVGSVILGRASLVPKTPSPSWSARRPPKPPGVRQNFVRPNVRRNATQAFEHHRALCHFILFWFFEFDTSCPIWRVLVFGKCVPAKFGWRTVMSFHF